jgi:F-type H+-transporting ATPase subunit gamma
MAGTRELQRRIKSIKGTRKITRAMQLVSAAKMRKAQGSALGSRTYAGMAWELINRLHLTTTVDHPLLHTYPEAKKTGIVVISSNRGLVGSFNTNLLQRLQGLEHEQPEIVSELVVVGKKVRDITSRLGKKIIAEFPKSDGGEHIESVYALAKLLADAYMSGEYTKIIVLYNHFFSTLVQKATAKQLLPFTHLDLESTEQAPEDIDYLYEPDANNVLSQLLPRIIESQLYQALLESDASEHSARMIMMKNATEAAEDLIEDFTLAYNQLRQNKITTELSEITAGKIALEQKT